MPRPSLKQQRSEEILRAFSSCVAQFGLDGASLEKVADVAGMNRSILRHYIGNREDLIIALTDKVTGQFVDQLNQWRNLPATGDKLDNLLQEIFSEPNETSTEMVLVLNALICASPRYPSIQIQLQNWMKEFVGMLKTEILAAYPNTTDDVIHPIAFSISSNYFNMHVMQSINCTDCFIRTNSLAAARSLTAQIA